MATKIEKDAISGTNTTGHEWDGIKELNTPLPRWWVLTLYATIVWAIGYWVLYPAWPTLNSYTRGVLGYSQYKTLAETMAAAEAKKAPYLNRMEASSFPQIVADKELLDFAIAGGGAAFAIKTDLLKGDQHLKNGLKAMEAKQFPKAKEFFEFAFDVEPNAMHEAYLTYADFMMNPMRKYEDALERMEIIIKQEPDHEVPHYLMAQTYRAMGDSNAAIRKLKEVIRLNPGHVSANREIVMICKEADEKKSKKKRFFR